MGNPVSQDNGNKSRRKPKAPTYLQRFFLHRLQRMVAVRRDQSQLLDSGDLNLRLLDKAVYSTFCDCLDLGAVEEARTILRNDYIDIDRAEPEARSDN